MDVLIHSAHYNHLSAIFCLYLTLIITVQFGKDRMWKIIFYICFSVTAYLEIIKAYNTAKVISDYAITGAVEDVVYTNTGHCYIAIDVDSIINFKKNSYHKGDAAHRFHRVTNQELCRFAERQRTTKDKVFAYCLRIPGTTLNNEIISIQFNGTNSKWWDL